MPEIKDSFTQAGQKCDLSVIDRPGNPDPWGDYCDCMFLEYQERTELYVNGSLVVIPVPQFTYGLQDSATIEQQKATRDWIASTFKGQRIEFKRMRYALRGAEWDKCARNFCADLTGLTCWNKKRGANDPFNIGVGITSPPWTDLGASSRGIQLRDGGFFYTLGQVFSLDATEYTPLKLWNTFWFNPAKYGVLYAKLFLIPGLGTAIQIAMTPLPFAPFPVPWQLLPLALAQATVEGQDVGKLVFMPMIKGGVKFISTGVQYLGKCGVGVNVPCGIGIALQTACQDQIDTGEIARIGDPVSRAIIRFLARNGAKLVDSISNALTGAKDPTVLGMLSTLFLTLSTETSFDANTRSVFKVFYKSFKIAQIVFEGFQLGLSPLTIVDKIIYELFNISLSQLSTTARVSVQAARDSLKAAASSDSVPLEQAAEMLSAISGTVKSLARVINDVSNTLGGALADLVRDLNGAATALSGAQAETQNTLAKLNIAPTIQPVSGGIVTSSSSSVPAPVTSASGLARLQAAQAKPAGGSSLAPIGLGLAAAYFFL